MANRTVLVVDDDRLVRDSLCEVVMDLGAEATGSRDGSAALAWAQTHVCDLVVSDVDMPGMSGFELLARLQDLRPGPPPVVLMSARADELLSRQATSAGAVTLLPKPVPTAAFTALINRLLAP